MFVFLYTLLVYFQHLLFALSTFSNKLIIFSNGEVKWFEVVMRVSLLLPCVTEWLPTPHPITQVTLAH